MPPRGVQKGTKRARQYEHIKKSERQQGASESRAKEIAAWTVPDNKEREGTLAKLVTPAIRFRDRYSLLDGIADLVAHIGASQRFMPGIHLERRGDVRHCQGTVLADWVARSSDGQEKMSGTSVSTREFG